MTLGREQQQLGLHPTQSQRDEQPLALLDRAGPVVLGVDDHRRCGDGIGERERVLRGDPVRVGATYRIRYVRRDGVWKIARREPGPDFYFDPLPPGVGPPPDDS